MQSVVQLVTAVSTGELFLGGEKSTESYRKAIYLRALGCASVNRVIAEELYDECGDEAFLVGVMQDVGQLVFLSVLGEKYISDRSGIDGCPANWERGQYEVDHAEVGEFCARNWGIPKDIHTAIGNHHNDISEDEHPLSRIAAVGQLLASHWGIGMETANPVGPEKLEFVSSEKLDEMEAEAREIYQAICELCGGGQ